MQTWKYTLPAFLVPFAFVLTDNGEGLLRAEVDRRHGLDGRGRRAGRGRAGRGHRRVVDPTGGWPERLLCDSGSSVAAVPQPGDDRRGSAACSPWLSPCTSLSRVQTTSGITRSAGCDRARVVIVDPPAVVFLDRDLSLLRSGHTDILHLSHMRTCGPDLRRGRLRFRHLGSAVRSPHWLNPR